MPSSAASSAILGTITGPIGGALTEINQIRAEALKEEQQLLWPLALIRQTETYISTIKASYRGWMNNVFAMPISSASLPTPRILSRHFEWPHCSDRQLQPVTSTYESGRLMGAAPRLAPQRY